MRREDDDFRPRTGKPKAGRSAPRRFTSQVLRSAQSISAGSRPRFGQRAERGSSGRGRVAAAILGDRLGPRARRVVVKARLVVFAQAAAGSAAVHLRYLQRDGVSQNAEPGQVYGPTGDHADGEAFLERGKGDRHQFRFIVSPEDAGELDLRAFTRDLMTKAEADLGTRLDWIAVDHHNTDNPHTHLIVRGVDDQGRDLVIARDYISHGLRLQASALATDLLGPQTEQELATRLDREVAAERWTSLDRRLQERARDGVVELGGAANETTLRLRARLQTLEGLGLAQDHGSGRFALRADLEPTLRAMGERGDIIRTMQRAFAGRAAPLEIAGATSPRASIGRVIAKGLADELGDRGYLVVEGLDGKGRYVALPPGVDLGAYPQGGVVKLQARAPGPRPADRAIAAVADAGEYRPARHLALAQAEARAGEDPEAFVGAHVRRLEALRRAGIVERVDQERWRLPADFLERATAYETGRFGAVQVEVLADGPPQRQARLLGVTWLDRALIDGGRPGVTGFGAEAREALEERRAYLVEQGLAERRGSAWRPMPDLLASLRRRELEAVGAQVSGEMGLEYRPLTDGDRTRGTYTRALNLVSGRFAMIDDGMGFSLVPWRPVLENRIGQSVGVAMRSSGVDWSFGRSSGR